MPKKAVYQWKSWYSYLLYLSLNSLDYKRYVAISGYTLGYKCALKCTQEYVKMLALVSFHLKAVCYVVSEHKQLEQ